MNLRDRSSLSMPRSSATGVSPLVPWFSLYGVSHGTPSRFGRGGRCRRSSSISPRPWNTIEPSSLAKVVLLILEPRATKYTQIFSWKCFFFPRAGFILQPSELIFHRNFINLQRCIFPDSNDNSSYRKLCLISFAFIFPPSFVF